MTNRDFWLARNGKIRIAKKRHDCDSRRGGIRCAQNIEPGDSYLDSGEMKGSFRTYKYCSLCADIEE